MQHVKESAMSTPSLIAVPAAFVLVLTSTAVVAQDKPASTTASKPVTTLSKAAAKQATKATTVPQDTMAKTVKQRTEKESGPSGTQSTPVSERSYDECHHAKDSDA